MQVQVNKARAGVAVGFQDINAGSLIVGLVARRTRDSPSMIATYPFSNSPAETIDRRANINPKFILAFL